MAQKVQTLFVCDAPHVDSVPGAETIAFSLGKVAYEIDVCDDHADEIRDAFGPFIGVARRVTVPSRNGRSSRGRGATSNGSSGQVPIIRNWAKAQGLEVSERGRIAQTVIDQYQAAH